MPASGADNLFSEPARSPYDWEFFFLGFHVRVGWTFWVFSALIGYAWARGLDMEYYEQDLVTPGLGILLAIWIGVSFVSILIHELGHSVAMKYYGIDSYIVLYHMGGLAVPRGTTGLSRSRLTHWNQIVISLAGPAAQFAFGAIVAAVAFSIGHPMGVAGWLLGLLGVPLPISEPFSNAIWTGLIDAAIFTSIFWALVNLLPVLPLDGGRIMQNIIGWNRRTSGFEEATKVSILVCVAIVFGALQIRDNTLAFYFVVIGVINFQNLQDGSYRL